MAFRWTQADLDAFERRRQQMAANGHVPVRARAVPSARQVSRSRRSELEEMLDGQLRAAGILGYSRQHRPIEGRKWTLDFAFVEMRRGIEVQGMVHRIKDKFHRDIEKRAELMLAGWRVLEVNAEAIRDVRAMDWIRRLIA